MDSLIGRWIVVMALVLCMAEATIFAQGVPPEEAAQRMTVAEGFEVKLVASEPLVRQPVAIDFDDRGRIWVMQYLQYPNPAGLKRVKVDQHTRSKYDRVPKPPPHGPKGADRLTILEDTDGDGHMDRAKDFVNGLNLASGFAFGHGGVFVLQAPYLLFYPDRNRDDLPDSDPEVLLRGFGMDDASSVANSLTFGPDGWLYGCQGSTVTAVIRGIKFVQAIWRYHPVSKKFELFAEGGGNMWGLDFDRHGNLLASTNVGGFTMLHMVQGGYYWKQFSKHGPLRNPYTFGYFNHMPHKNFRGGHVTVGGTLYQGDTFPEEMRNKYISTNLLSHEIHFHEIHPDGTSFRSAHGGELVKANDTWFAPNDLTVGPDGAVYFSDWHDKRTAHPNPDADWDRSNGRIFRVQAKGVRSEKHKDLLQMPSNQLVKMLNLSNEWYVRAARRELVSRGDQSIWPQLRKTILQNSNNRLVLNSLWTLASTGGLDQQTALKALTHQNEHIRAWTVRLLGDEQNISPPVTEQFNRLAKSDPSAIVRSQLASTAARIPAKQGLSIAHTILLRNADGKDPYIPLLLWWAVEQHAMSAIDDIEQRFVNKSAWQKSLIREEILNRLMQRLAVEATPRTLAVCKKLIESAPSSIDEQNLLTSLDAGLAMVSRRRIKKKRLEDRVPADLKQWLAEKWNKQPSNFTLIKLNGRLGNRAVADYALKVVTNDQTEQQQRRTMFNVLRQFGDASSIAPLLPLLAPHQPTWLKQAAMDVLARYDDERVGETLLKAYTDYDSNSRAYVRRVLFARPEWTKRFLTGIDGGMYDPREVSLGELNSLSAYKDESISELLTKHWGQINRSTAEQKITEIRRVRFNLKTTGDPKRGHGLFTKHCATCHQLFGEGKKLGPDLTTANRKDLNYLLESIINPNAFIRKEFVSSVVLTQDGRVLTGIIVKETPTQIVLADNKNKESTVRREDIEEIHNASVSLMPEDVLKPLKDQELRDLFSYLQSEGTNKH
ncbi:PVC-type heme-binding CxxCH protein [Gimesia aquarii]|uniref:Cytochrome c n=1 Tax=Gimesia aquarii TaxID=2527964 RepID=A0A517VSK2_9PLAN|nr:PVC-type heme-binding CxxCH protein [Gimesia aquarii]QDT95950.1 Cytochrome c [Gimesia aquarii]